MQQRELLRRRRTTPRVPNLGIASHRAVEALERRTMLCAVHTYHDPAESTAVPDGYQGPDGGGADIIWTNRGTTDNFGNFGAQAETARRVVDAVLVAFERMIGDFNYSNGTNNFNLTLLTSGSGHGASASLNTGTILSGLPKSGTVNMGGGTGGTGGGWFFDPTPEEHSEFQGSIVNAFSGDAQAGSPASGRGDFYTVVAAEVAHCLGLYGSVLPGWAARTTNTGVPDTAEGGGRGTFYAFQGPSIKHLLTSNNGGAGGQNWGSAVHAAGPGVNVSFGGDTYTGAQDIGNAVYEFSRRYIPNRAFSLMFKDAYAYSTVDPDRYGTFYALPATATGNVVVRGGTAASVDTISLSVSGSALLVSVDPLADVPGTGHLPGAGDLPAFVTEYDISQVSSISIASGDGNDTINVDGLPAGVTLTIQAGNGADTINVNETDPAATVVLMPSIGNDAVTINADGAGAAAARFDGTHTLTTLVLGAGGTLSGAGNVTVTNAMTWSGGTMTGTGQTVIAAGATLSVTGTGLRHSDRVIEIGGSAAMDAGGGLVLRTAGLELGPVGALDVRDNALILDYSGAASPLADVQTALTTGYAGGLWSGPGITSSTAAAAASHALGYAEAADVLAAFPATFAGQSVDDTTVLVRYTRNGDANLDGTVNLTDFNKLASSFGQLNTDWAQGNFNFDLTTNLADFNLLASNFGQTAAAASRGSSTGKTGGGVSDEDDDQLLA
jgi:hypothetical protein